MSSFSRSTVLASLGASLAALVATGLALGAAPAQASDLTWTIPTSPAASNWSDVAFGNGTFVAVSSSPLGSVADRVMTSTDGLTWTGHSAAADKQWISVIYGNGIFMAVSAITGDVMTSPDGATWTSGASTGFDTRAVAFGNGVFVATGIKNARVVTSSDNGAAWDSVTGVYPSQFYANTFGNNMFISAGKPTGAVADVMYSYSSGSTWNPSTHVNGSAGVPQHHWNDISYGAGTFVAVGQLATGYRAMTSTDGINWIDRATPVDNAWEGVTYGDGLFVAVADNVASGTAANDRIMTSSDGISWTLESGPTDGSWQSITYGNGMFVAVGSGGVIMTSGSGGGGGGVGGTGLTPDQAAPADIIQQVEVLTDSCTDYSNDALNWGGVSGGGWTQSWAQWVNEGVGGAVCTRTLAYSAAQGAWTITR